MQRWIALALLLLLTACGSATTPNSADGVTLGTLRITDAWARPAGTSNMEHSATTTGPMSDTHDMGSMSGANGAAYMTITSSGAADRLLSVTSDIAATVETHTVENKDGVMAMRPVEGIDVPANGSVQLKPGGYHVMLLGLKQELKEGDTFDVSLKFEQAGSVTVQVTVRQP